MINDNLLRFNLDKTKFLAWDCETEGLNLFSTRPWELGWSVYQGKKLLESHQYYINWPNLNVSPDAARITGFSMDTIKKYGKDPKEVMDKFDSYLYDPQYKVLGANLLGYDCYIHNVCRKLLGKKTDYSYITRLYDTIALSKAYNLGLTIPEDPKEFLPFLYRMINWKQKGLKSSNSFMFKTFGGIQDPTREHKVEFDVEMTKYVFDQLIYKMDIV